MINLTSELENVRTVAIAGHVKPDGDCIGSCLGMYLYLTTYFPEIQTDVFLGKIAPEYNFLKGVEKIRHDSEGAGPYDVFISLDSSDRERLGPAGELFDTAEKTICIDHHVSNQGFAQVNYIVPDASSTSELVFEVIGEERVTREMAEAIYTGIASDTGVFQYSCTSSRTMNIAGMLMDKGIDFSWIVDETFYKKTYLQNQILGRALMESMLLLDGKCIVSGFRKKDMDFYHVGPLDFEGIVNQLRLTEGVEVAVFLYESGNQEFKVSMRSKSQVDVSGIAVYFGGGGHVRAAGCTMQGTMFDVINNLTPHIEKQLKRKVEQE
ncbi:bifunctional oligoribonuclease/PAP phosphatase NrnA [Diplocloster hominis]|uniref:DHH family phosphoesterase n=1 Tax=Diplocloster hominis TaxID=3079010 RepID=UPI0031BA9255